MIKAKVFPGMLIILTAGICLTTGCPPKRLLLSEADNGKTVVVNAGQEVVVTLRGNPTTGYGWEVKDLDADFLAQVGETEFRSDNAGRPGSGGTMALTFKALKPGSAALTLVYRRSWETGVAPLDSYRINVRIGSK